MKGRIHFECRCIHFEAASESYNTKIFAQLPGGYALEKLVILKLCQCCKPQQIKFIMIGKYIPKHSFKTKGGFIDSLGVSMTTLNSLQTDKNWRLN